MASVQLIRLVSVRTESRRASSGGGPGSRGSSESAVSRRNSALPQDRIPLSHHQGGDENVRIEVFAHGVLGREFVSVASLSNSVLLITRMGGPNGKDNDTSLRSWLLEWPVQGKIRGLCVSPDLECVLCVTEDLEGVYILAIDNLDAEGGQQGSAVPGGNTVPQDLTRDLSEKIHGGAAARVSRASFASTATVAAAGPSARPAQRAVAASAFPSLLHLASRGQRRKAGGAVAHTPAEPVFIASLVRGAGRSSKRRTSTSGRASTGGGRSRFGSRGGVAQLECIWWAARNGDHFAVIGRPDGEVHFLDLERLHSWVVSPPPPTSQRGRVCALTIESATATLNALGRPRMEDEDSIHKSTDISDAPVPQPANPDQRHLVTVLESGAVFLILLERGRPDSGHDEGTADGVDGVGEESKVGHPTELVTGHRGRSKSGSSTASDYARLGVDHVNDPEFAPTWLDVGRGSSGSGSGGTGVRVMPPDDSAGSSGSVSRKLGPSPNLQLSVVSRSWGNKCTVKMLSLFGNPDAGDSAGHPRERTSARTQALRTETVKQVTLPTDHPSPEQHALAVVNGAWAILASPPTSGTPARVTVASLDEAERPAPASVRVFPLPAGERVGGVMLLPGQVVMSGVRSLRAAYAHSVENSKKMVWGLVWSDAGIYRVDFGGNGTPLALPNPDSPSPPPPSRPPPSPPPLPPPRTVTLRNPMAAITVRRPSAAAVRRARELQASGYLDEAAEAAIEALDGKSVPVASVTGLGSAHGKEESVGGVTTRMVREDLANTLVEWLVTLHVKRPKHVAPTAPVDHTAAAASPEAPSNRVGARGRARQPTHRDDLQSARSTHQPRTSTRRGGKRSMSARPSKREFGEKGDITSPSPTIPLPGSPSRLEQFLLSSLDYDPILAATLLHAHGQADLAVIAAAARGSAISGVIRVLAESTWPPRLGRRAVQSLCTVGAGAEVVHAGGGALFAALEPTMRIRILISDHRALFYLPGDENTNGSREDTAAVKDDISAAKTIHTEDYLGSARGRISPLLPALSVGELAELCSRLARWYNGELLSGRVEKTASAVRSPLDTPCNSLSFPFSLERQIVQILLDVLLELGSRQPPSGAGHRHAWLEAGCTTDAFREQSTSVMAPAADTNDDAHLAGDLPEGDTPQEVHSDQPGWSGSTAASLREVLQREGVFCELNFSESEVGGVESVSEVQGGLPTAARRVLLSVLPLLQGLFDPVVVLLNAMDAGCWAVVALQLELSGTWQDAASAKLHGVVSVLQGGQSVVPGKTTRILNGLQPRGKIRGANQKATDGDGREMSITQLLRILDTFVFPGNDVADGSSTSRSKSTLPLGLSTSGHRTSTRSVATAEDEGAVLARASILASVVCIWERFQLPVVSLEAALSPRLVESDGARVLTALFFPQLFASACKGQSAASGAALGGLSALGTESGQGEAQEASSGPTQAQIDCAENLGLSPRFHLALVRAGARVAALDSNRTAGLGMRTGPAPPVGPTLAGTQQQTSSPTTRPALLAHENRTSSPALLALLLDNRADAMGASSIRISPAVDGAASNSDGRRMSREKGSNGSLGLPAAGSSTRRESISGLGNTGDEDMVWFSCGHRFAKEHLLRTVVPACVSRLHHATSSLQRTEQILIREYERQWKAGAACPECASKELRRLVSAPFPAAGAAPLMGRAHSMPISLLPRPSLPVRGRTKALL